MPIALQCGACQKQFKARDELAGKTVKCPACQTPLVIPGGQATPQQSAPASDGFQDLLADELPDRPLGVPGMADTKCPGCGAVVNPEAVLCVDCGYDFTKQKQIVPDTPSDREARFQARADKMAGRDVDPVKKKSGAAGHGPGGSGVVWLLFSFEGRIPRRVFWLASAGLFGYNFFCGFIAGGMLGAMGGGENGEGNAGVALAVLGLLLVFLLIGVIANLAVEVKRLHDRGRAGYMVLLPAIPIIGPFFAVWLLVEMGLLRGTEGPNEYGDDPT